MKKIFFHNYLSMTMSVPLFLIAAFLPTFLCQGEVTRDILDAMTLLNTGMERYQFPDLLEETFDCMNRVNPDLLPASVTFNTSVPLTHYYCIIA